MKKKSPPCIRGLDCFKKSGCPEREWNGEEGCPAWIELPTAKKSNPLEKEIRKQCIDKWSFDFHWASVGLMESVAQGGDQLRNGLLMKDDQGQLIPKPDMVMYSILKGTLHGNSKRISQSAAKKISDSGMIEITEEEKDAQD